MESSRTLPWLCHHLTAGFGQAVKSTTWFTPEWAEAFQAEIWRTNKENAWERVHPSGVIPMGGGDFAPDAYGYRALAEFDGYLYACGIGTWMPPLPTNTVVRSATGDPGSWEDGRDTALAVGTANPFTGRLNGGCEVWLRSETPPWGAPAAVLGEQCRRASGMSNTLLVLFPPGAVLVLRFLRRGRTG